MKQILWVLFILLGSCADGTQALEHNIQSGTSIGAKQFIWVDQSRVDEYYGGSRLINAQVWYPAEIDLSANDHTPYYFQIHKAYKHLENWSEEDYKSVSSIRTKSSLNAPMKKGPNKYPLILFSPSLGGNLSQYTFYAECFAEKGYIVMGINHLYESEYVIDLNGNPIIENQSFHDSLKTLNIPTQITADRYREVKGMRQKVLGLDLLFSLDQLLNESFFREKINTSQIGAFGHSIGGSAVIYASLLDERIKAVVDWDGTPPTAALQNGIAPPFMFIEDLTDYENHPGYAKLHSRRNSFCERNKSESWRVLFGGATHNSFLDINYFLSESDVEKKMAYGFLQKTMNYMDAFFAHHLKSGNLQIEEIQSDSLEVFRFRKSEE